MNKLKHTPGPWMVDECNNLQINSEIDGAVCWTETCVGIEKDKANARLISAAPEMLECLIDIIKLSKELRPALFKATLLKEINVVEKATGLKIKEVLNNE